MRSTSVGVRKKGIHLGGSPSLVKGLSLSLRRTTSSVLDGARLSDGGPLQPRGLEIPAAVPLRKHVPNELGAQIEKTPGQWPDLNKCTLQGPAVRRPTSSVDGRDLGEAVASG